MTVTRDRVRVATTARIAAVVATIISSCGVGVLGLAAPASAETVAAPTQLVQFSTDGIHYSDSYSELLFHDVQLVPGGSARRSFYVRNGATVAAILRVTLADVSTNSIPLATAMSMSTSTTGVPGAAVPLTRAQPCATLSQGLRLSEGDSIRLDNTVSLGDLSGSDGNNGTVWFALRVSFSSTDAGAPAPDTCPVDYGQVDTFPNPATNPVSSTGTAFSQLTATGWRSATTLGGETSTPPTNLSVAGGSSPPLTQTLVSNTARFYQEYDVAFWLAMSALGWLIFILVRRRRAADRPEPADNTRQIGTR